MELFAALLVLVVAVGITSWALVAHRGGLRLAGPHHSAPASNRSVSVRSAPQSHSSKVLYDQDVVESDDVERDIWGDPVVATPALEQDAEPTDHDDLVIEWERSVPSEQDLWGEETITERSGTAELEHRAQPVDGGVDIWADATD